MKVRRILHWRNDWNGYDEYKDKWYDDQEHYDAFLFEQKYNERKFVLLEIHDDNDIVLLFSDRDNNVVHIVESNLEELIIILEKYVKRIKSV